MDITRRCDYACRILRAAYHSGESYVSVSDVAEAEGIPYAFARSIQHDLVKGGLIKTVRGARGGLALNCDPTETTLLDVLEAVQGPVSVSLCAIDPGFCAKQGQCAYNKLWQGADALLNDYFSSITLKDLIEQGSSHPVVEAAMKKAPTGRHSVCASLGVATAPSGAPASSETPVASPASTVCEGACGSCA